jgi:hypothetical protein
MRLPTTSASSIEWVTNSIVKPISSHRPAALPACAPGERVERGEGFVHQQDFRLHGQRARDRHPRFHAARQRVRVGVGKARQPDLGQPVARALAASALFMPPASSGNMTFCSPSSRAAAGRIPGTRRCGPAPADDGLAVQQQAAGARRDEAADGLQQGRLAAARRPEQHEAVAPVTSKLTSSVARTVPCAPAYSMVTCSARSSGSRGGTTWSGGVLVIISSRGQRRMLEEVIAPAFRLFLIAPTWCRNCGQAQRVLRRTLNCIFGSLITFSSKARSMLALFTRR